MRTFSVTAIVTAAAAAAVLSACSDPPARTPAVVTAPTMVAPPAKPAVTAIYTAFVANPSGFDRRAVLSRFYVEDNARVDADCAAGKDHPRCNGDRFACIPMGTKATTGSVTDTVIVGEQPNVSASVKVAMRFGKTDVTADVDVVYEDGAWKIDQVRCGP